MLEVEMKFPVADWTALEKRLAEWGAKDAGKHAEVDHYFNAPDRDFARTDEALRVRRIDGANFVAYKGPKRDAQTKTRTEIEVELEAGEPAAAAFEQLLTSLGYRFVAEVGKLRRRYHLQRGEYHLEVSLDEVKDVGRFVELEILAAEAQLAEARAALLQTAADLGLQGSERRSYLELLLAGDAARRA